MSKSRYTGKIDQQRGSRWDGFKVKLKTIVNETANLYTREYTERISQMLNLSDDYNPIEAASKNNTLVQLLFPAPNVLYRDDD